ncbi:MAG: hypothetical protein K1X92_17885 [Bacteroidia bacterium]|nr:hypothetical protein [Bacteroidia bacterium]
MRYIVILTAILLTMSTGCKSRKGVKEPVVKTETPPPPPPPPQAPEPPVARPIPVNDVEADIIRTIHAKIPTSRILRCRDKASGKTMYEAQMNAYDGPSTVFDENGEKKGTLSPLGGNQFKVELENCIDLFIPERNIWGLKPVDVYRILD